MYLPKYLLLGILSASALALPTNTTTHHLEKRASWGWISYFDDKDKLCQHENKHLPGNHFKLHGDHCYKWSPATHVVGVNFGTWPLAFANLALYDDDNCNKHIGNIKVPKSLNIDAPTTIRILGRTSVCLNIMICILGVSWFSIEAREPGYYIGSHSEYKINEYISYMCLLMFIDSYIDANSPRSLNGLLLMASSAAGFRQE